MVKSGCYFPWYRKDNKLQPIPCGRCPLCRKRNLNGWAVRAKHQLLNSDSAKFITLTYNDANLPFSKNGYMALSKRHVQNFFKRLRKAHEPKRIPMHVTSSGRILQPSHKRVVGRSIKERQKSIKYICVGEYGGRTYRPHYHILMFNCKTELIQNAWKNPITGKHMGHVDYGDKRGVSDMSTAYVLSYLSKPSTVGEEKWDDRPKEFKLVSKGFGLAYLTDEQKAWHIADLPNRMYCKMHGAKKCAMPRYYKDKLYNQLQKDKAFEVQTQKLIEQQLEELYRKDAKKLLSERRSWKENMKGAYRKMYSSSLKIKL